jgi:hypothetical protein
VDTANAAAYATESVTPDTTSMASTVSTEDRAGRLVRIRRTTRGSNVTACELDNGNLVLYVPMRLRGASWRKALRKALNTPTRAYV